MRFLWPCLLLTACTRDPSLLGYWEILEWQAGEDLTVVDAGTIEFTSDSKAFCIFRYSYTADGFVPIAQPDVQEVSTDVGASGDFVASYHEKGETYSATLTATGLNAWGGKFSLEDWTGSTVRLHSKAAIPFGGTEPIEMDLLLQR
jgi:hypothetical protein